MLQCAQINPKTATDNMHLLSFVVLGSAGAHSPLQDGGRGGKLARGADGAVDGAERCRIHEQNHEADTEFALDVAGREAAVD